MLGTNNVSGSFDMASKVRSASSGVQRDGFSLLICQAGGAPPLSRSFQKEYPGGFFWQ
jgi:hypothetical protein